MHSSVLKWNLSGYGISKVWHSYSAARLCQNGSYQFLDVESIYLAAGFSSKLLNQPMIEFAQISQDQAIMAAFACQ